MTVRQVAQSLRRCPRDRQVRRSSWHLLADCRRLAGWSATRVKAKSCSPRVSPSVFETNATAAEQIFTSVRIVCITTRRSTTNVENRTRSGFSTESAQIAATISERGRVEALRTGTRIGRGKTWKTCSRRLENGSARTCSVRPVQLSSRRGRAPSRPSADRKHFDLGRRRDRHRIKQ
jgi:hypothetical protein